MAPSPEFMQDLWVRKTFSTIGYTLLVYDYLLTLEDETCYIWNRPWTGVKVMFLINRYGNLIGQTVIQLEEAGLLSHGSQVFCHRFALFSSCFMVLSTESIHIIVLMRAWAIWGTQKRMTNILIWIYVSYVLVLMGMVTYSVTTDHIQFSQLDVTHICVSTIPIRYFKDYAWLICCGSVSTPLISSIYSFETQSYFSLTAYSDETIQSPKYFIAKSFATPLLSVAGQRLVLNLRGLKGRTYTTQDLSCEVDRQLEAFAAAESPCRDDMGQPEVIKHVIERCPA
ncbi:hypothetical protein EV702DRAFT_1041083 [Suillus placidus]|uniref:DUF6533 domain-containing protein n=1 Tax=Suillus placidus TaxID=48579 RepID=A0A9P7D9E4_9AGAM|nr:hypothetical protein EV702DRAFT_1041083 [Suillus placidus]